MNPGASARPSASMVWAARQSSDESIAQMRPSRIATSRAWPSVPEPSKTFALRMRRSQSMTVQTIDYLHCASAGGLPVAFEQSIRESLDSSISQLNKGLGALDKRLEPAQVRRLDWNLLREDLSLPAAVLYQDRLQHNLKWMLDFIAAYGVRLAPHGKTTMAPRLFEMQIQSGAWGITLATAHQTQVAYAHGVRRILMANEL